jgi:hypothetical protein
MAEVRFAQWELDDIAAAMEPVVRASVEETVVFNETLGDDVITGYEITARPDGLAEFLNRVVEVADRNRARAANNSPKLGLTMETH